jgi:hypothetical protein
VGGVGQCFGCSQTQLRRRGHNINNNTADINYTGMEGGGGAAVLIQFKVMCYYPSAG